MSSLPSARAETRPGYGGVLRGFLLDQPQTIVPVHADNHSELTLVTQLFDTLYKVDDDGRVVPHLAFRLPRVTGKTVIIPVRDGVVFHGGGALLPSELARSLSTVSKSDKRWLLAFLDPQTLRGDDSTGELTFDLSRSWVGTPSVALRVARYLASPNVAIARYRVTGNAKKVVAGGSGPFVLKRSQKQFELAANNDYFAGRPYLDTLILRWNRGLAYNQAGYRTARWEAREYMLGRVDISNRGEAFGSRSGRSRSRVSASPRSLLVYAATGTRGANAKTLHTVRFRRALSFLLDRNSFRMTGSGERVEPSVYPVSVDAGGRRTSMTQRSARLDKARDLLRAPGSLPAAMELIYDRTRLDHRDVVQRIITAASRVGGKIVGKALAPRVFRARRRKGDFDLCVDQLELGIADAWLQILASFAAGENGRRAWFVGAKYPSLRAIRQLFELDVPIIPVFHRAVRVHYRDVIQGIRFGATSLLDYADVFRRR